MIAEKTLLYYYVQDGWGHADTERRFAEAVTITIEECVRVVLMTDVTVDHDHHHADGRMGLRTKIKVMLRVSMVLNAKDGMKVCRDR